MMEPSKRHDDIAAKILDAAFIVHRELGPGLLESVYEICIADLLLRWGHTLERQKSFSVRFLEKTLDTGFKADLIVDNTVLIELKSCDRLAPVHEAQVLTYLKLSGLKLGLLINFNVPLLKQGIKRLVLTQHRGDRSVRSGLENESAA